jgi:hypothetical protein
MICGVLHLVGDKCDFNQNLLNTFCLNLSTQYSKSFEKYSY